MHVTVCICTRNRTKSLIRALASVAASECRAFDLLIVDQGSTDETEQSIRDLRATLPQFPRLMYIRSATAGASAAHNIAVSHATGDIIAFTDDDCEVLPQWLGHIVSYVETHPDVSQVCGAVLAGPYDPTRGFIPTYDARHERQVASPWLKWREGGIGANMAFRLDALRSVGPFDEMLGTGAPLHACLDGDMTYRMLKAGYTVATVPEICVIHHGFRTWDDGRVLMRNCGIGVAAAYTKHLRLGDVAVLPVLLLEWWRCISWRRLLLLRRHSGLRRSFAFMQGIALSFRYTIDRDSSTYHYQASPDAVMLQPLDDHVSVLPPHTHTPAMKPLAK
ncbi:MAG TPA: glycosyltransferase family A protein [Ktedonobacterales bacterium]